MPGTAVSVAETWSCFLIGILSHFDLVVNLIPTMKHAVVFASSMLVSAIALANSDPSETLVVTAKAPVEAENFAGTVSVISAEEIRLSGATNLIEVLQNAPGINTAISGDNSGKAIQIRGMDAEFGLILVNGKRIPNSDRNISGRGGSVAYRYNWVPLENIERIEIIRGPASSLYGADAMAGVINIITHKAGAEWTGSVTTTGIRNDTSRGGDGENYSVTASGPLGDHADLAFAYEKRSDNAIFNNDGSLTDKAATDVENYQLDLGIDLSDSDRIQLGLIHGNEEKVDIDSGFGGNSRLVSDQRRQRQTLDYITEIAGFNVNAGINRGNSELDDNGANWELDDKNFSLTTDGQLTDNHYLSAGIEYREEEIDRNDTTVFSDAVDHKSAYLQDIISLGEQHTLTLGLAHDRHSRYDAETSPKAYWNWQFSDNWALKTGYGESFVAPALREGSSAYVVFGGPGRFYQGNDDLQPETSKTFEIGTQYSGDQLTGSVTLFQNRIKNLISTVDSTVGPNTFATYTNIDQAEILGLETEWNWALSTVTDLRLSYTYLDTENQSADQSGNELPNRSEHTFKVTANHYLAAADLNLWGSWRYQSKQYADEANSTEIDAHSIVDLSVSREIGKHLELRAGIKNLLDEVVYDEAEMIEEGRSYWLSMTGRF